MSVMVPTDRQPTELASGRVYRVGGEIVLDGRVSWSPSRTSRAQPVNAYLLRGDHGSVLVDTGIRLHEDLILEQLGQLLTPGERLVILLTRTEMECCLNIPAIEARFNVTAVWYTGGITVPRSGAPVRRVSVEPGTSLQVEVLDGLVVELISPLLRLLPTLWVFDPDSGALLTSDAVTHGNRHASADPAAGLEKFQWFRRTGTAAIAADVRRIVHSRAVTAIGPGYGPQFLGPDECRRAAADLADCLKEVGQS